MSTEFNRLDCKSGCCLDKVKHLADQVFHEQDDMYNILAEEYILIGNFLVDELLPYLENKAVTGDTKAEELLFIAHALLRKTQL